MSTQPDEVNLSTYDDPVPAVPLAQPPPTESSLWNVHWRGYYESYPDGYRGSVGHLNLEIPQVDGTFRGTGSESLGDFKVFGKREGSQIAFTKVYPAHRGGAKYTYEGTFNCEGDEITGSYCYGRPVDEATTFPLMTPNDALGSFVLKRRPLYYFLFRPHQSQFDYNRPRALWRFALNAIQHASRARARKVPWDFFKERRDLRRKYVELYMQFDELSDVGKDAKILPQMSTDESAELANLEMSISTSDLLFYRSLARCLMRREVIHLYVVFFLFPSPKGCGANIFMTGSAAVIPATAQGSR